MNRKFYNSYAIYRAKPTKDGAASQLQFSKKASPETEGYPKFYLFWESVKQTGIDENGNASFGWKDPNLKITMKLEEVDIGELLAVLNGIKLQAGGDKGIYHSKSKGSSTIMQFSKYIKDDKFLGYGLRLSKKNEDMKEPLVISHMISVAEGEILRLLLQQAVLQFYKWE